MPEERYKWDFFLAHAGADLSAAEQLYVNKKVLSANEARDLRCRLIENTLCLHANLAI